MKMVVVGFKIVMKMVVVEFCPCEKEKGVGERERELGKGKEWVKFFS
jgi:hypothetical protein